MCYILTDWTPLKGWTVWYCIMLVDGGSIIQGRTVNPMYVSWSYTSNVVGIHNWCLLQMLSEKVWTFDHSYPMYPGHIPLMLLVFTIHACYRCLVKSVDFRSLLSNLSWSYVSNVGIHHSCLLYMLSEKYGTLDHCYLFIYSLSTCRIEVIRKEALGSNT